MRRSPTSQHAAPLRDTEFEGKVKQVISPYGFLVQLLLIIEVVAAVGIKRAIKRRISANQKETRTSTANVQSARIAVTQPVLENESVAYREERDFVPSLSSVFFLCCSLGNLWLAAKALQRSWYGLFFVGIGFGLLVAAYKASFVSRFRRK